MNTFYSIAYSPWSERARWALQAAQIPFQNVAFVPTVTDARLRLALRRPLGRLTVPVLFVDGGPALDDSLDIARWASQQAPERLPFGQQTQALWQTASRLLEASRIRTTWRALDDEALLRANLPTPLRKAGPLGLRVGKLVARKLLKKYPAGSREACLDTMRQCLQELRPAVEGKKTIEGQFSVADIAVATSLAMVQPAPGRWARLSDTARRGWTEPALAQEFAELLAWRDQLYRDHRGTQP